MMNSSATKGRTELHLTSIEWLAAHNGAKLEERKRMIKAHGLEAGEKVLDLACGPGYWTPLIANEILPDGMITGIDFDPQLIDFATSQYCDLIKNKRAEFILGDIRSLPFEDNTFDVVICGNAYNYFEDISELFTEHLRVLKLGGKFVVRAFDNTTSVYHPLPTSLLLKIMLGASQGLENSNNGPFMDNYLGKKMHGIFQAQENLIRVKTKTYLTQKTQPINMDVQRYLSMKALWYAEMAEEWCDQKDLIEWRRLFDVRNHDCILFSPDLYFSTVEMVTTAIKGAP